MNSHPLWFWRRITSRCGAFICSRLTQECHRNPDWVGERRQWQSEDYEVLSLSTGNLSPAMLG